MRGLTGRWNQRPAANGSMHPGQPLIDRLLSTRGLSSPDAREQFLDPRLVHLHDPALLPNIDTAVERLIDAIRRRQKIVIYGDYDVDGVSGCAILYHIIRALDPDAPISLYIPHRLDEGYGLNCDAMRALKDDGAEVVITVDCGIRGVEAAATCRSLGIDLIITDHHKPAEHPDEYPDALTIVHPGLAASQYPCADLCGAGVAFKLAWRLATTWCGSERVSKVLQDRLLEMLPLTALATIADVVPLTGENRVLTTFGLRLIRQTPLPGLRALIETSNLMDESIDSEKVGFVLGPRLNACGRLGHARDALQLLTTDDHDIALATARELAAINRQRQDQQKRIFEQAAEQAEKAGMTCDDCRAIVLASPDWHPGVVGIVCSRLVDAFCRPAVLLQRSDDICKGSARSIDGYSIHDGLSTCADLLTTFGGHDMAAGLSLIEANIDELAQRFTEHANQHISSEHLLPAIEYDCTAVFEELINESVEQIQRMGPFGRGNPTPAVRIEDAIIAAPPSQIGKQGKHLALKLRQNTNGQQRWLRCVWWNQGHRASDIAAGMTVDAVIEPKLNTWNGRTNVEAVLRDIAIAQT